MAYEVHAYHGFYVTINFYALHDHQSKIQVMISTYRASKDLCNYRMACETHAYCGFY